MKKLLTLITTLLTVLSIHSYAFNDKKPSTTLEPQKSISTEILIVDINQADPKALLSLKGIGKKKAQAIINYRQKNGDFTDINDLLKVQGIGMHVVKENKNRLKI
ncbi:MAG: helix-hairpin-helix domain-containing protein [Colwelliaceae bacterium]|nr:helix-hairpin-helix domain-containing protein [Colwelliaceae bacterium]